MTENYLKKRFALFQLLLNVSTYNDGDIALRELTNDAILIPDIIFLDLNMSRLNGYDFFKLAKESNALKNVPIVIFSTATLMNNNKNRIEGAYAYLSKPTKFSELVASIKEIIRS